MTKGFKNPAGKFQPIKDHKKGTKMKNGKSIKPTGIRLPSLRKQRDVDSGEIPPNEIYDESRLVNHNGRYFLVMEGYGGTLSVDEYEEVNEDLFKHKGTIYFAQSSEDVDSILQMTGGGRKTEYGYELDDEKKFIEGLDSAGALEV